MPKIIRTEDSITIDIIDQWENYSGKYVDVPLAEGSLEILQDSFPDATDEELGVMIANAIKKYLKEMENE